MAHTQPPALSPTVCQCTPTNEDVAALRAFRASGRPEADLGDAERIMTQLMDVPSVEARLRCYSYKFITPHKISSATNVSGGHGWLQARMSGYLNENVGHGPF